MKQRQVHVGAMLREQLRKNNQSPKWLSENIPYNYNSLFKIFKKPELEMHLLLRISHIMHFDFYQQCYKEIENEE